MTALFIIVGFIIIFGVVTFLYLLTSDFNKIHQQSLADEMEELRENCQCGEGETCPYCRRLAEIIQRSGGEK